MPEATSFPDGRYRPGDLMDSGSNVSSVSVRTRRPRMSKTSRRTCCGAAPVRVKGISVPALKDSGSFARVQTDGGRLRHPHRRRVHRRSGGNIRVKPVDDRLENLDARVEPLQLREVADRLKAKPKNTTL